MIIERRRQLWQWILIAILILLVILLLSTTSADVVRGGTDRARWPVPAPLVAEHRELHAQLAAAAEAGGKTGEAAREVARLLHPHFVREEEFALPPLDALSMLARGERPER